MKDSQEQWRRVSGLEKPMRPALAGRQSRPGAFRRRGAILLFLSLGLGGAVVWIMVSLGDATLGESVAAALFGAAMFFSAAIAKGDTRCCPCGIFRRRSGRSELTMHETVESTS